MQRYDVNWEDYIHPKDDGRYVLYSDASSVLTASEARVVELEKTLGEVVEWIKNAPEDTWGYAHDDVAQWPIRAELVAKIAKSLVKSRALGDVTATKGEDTNG